MMAKLNLGCGRTALPGFIGLDMTLSAAVDVQASATELPFKDEVFDLVVASHILEHIPDSVLVSQGNGRFRQTLGLDCLRDEVDRVLRPGEGSSSGCPTKSRASTRSTTSSSSIEGASRLGRAKRRAFNTRGVSNTSGTTSARGPRPCGSRGIFELISRGSGDSCNGRSCGGASSQAMRASGSRGGCSCRANSPSS